MNEEKPRQQGHISMVNHVFVSLIHGKTEFNNRPTKTKIVGINAFNTYIGHKAF